MTLDPLTHCHGITSQNTQILKPFYFHIFQIHNFLQVCELNLLKPTGYVMQHQFNIQQLHALPTLYLCVLCLSENKQRLVPLTAQTDWFL